MLDFPETAYDNNPRLNFSVDFVTPRTLRIRMMTSSVAPADAPLLCWQEPLVRILAGNIRR